MTCSIPPALNTMVPGGKIEAFVDIGPTLPPQRKGRLPQYNRNILEELQDKFDELEAAGVFTKAELVNVVKISITAGLCDFVKLFVTL